jgi:hypothetical protein
MRGDRLDYATEQAHLLSGPHAQESRSTGGSLQEPAEENQWPTISSNATTGGRTGLAGGSGTRASLEKMLGRPEALKLNAKLNPRWVETLMGLPIGWTMPSCSAPVTIESMNCACSETESCQPPLRRLGEFSMGDCWRTPAVADPGITVERLEGEIGSRMYDKETGRNCQYGLTQQVQLVKEWPTIRASDAEHGGPNQRGSKGDLMLPSAVQRPESLWLTPDVPNGGRSPKMETTITGKKADGSKAQVGLANQVKILEVQKDWPTPVHGCGPNSHGQISGQYRREMDVCLNLSI